MSTTFKIAFFSFALLLHSCADGQTNNGTKTALSVTEFEAKIKTLPDAPVVDVRTHGEFANGHLQNALNCDWNGSEFDKQISTIDKSKPVFVYCMSGGRSGAAAAKMRKDGFKEVYEMSGGMIKWRATNLPEVKPNGSASLGMTAIQFDSLLRTDKLVLVDFYAEWCAPCKKMKPYLDEISKELADKVVVVRLDTDQHQALCKALKVDALPVLQLYKNKTLVWTHQGFIEKAEVLKQL